ncbi:heat shock 70kDa protein [Acrasis kona]|uniref:Heat shock 70kDa protein n=1 Tax=Acrasis kona TaxID=1008807 RepID=A0AAW2Z665_9EUKA
MTIKRHLVNSILKMTLDTSNNIATIMNHNAELLKQLSLQARLVRSDSTNMKCCPVIGIDLGTTYSCAAVWKNNEIKIITTTGKRTIPSVVSFIPSNEEEDGQLLFDVIVGEQALKKLNARTVRRHKHLVSNTIFESKRLIGLTMDEVKDFKSRFPFEVVAGGDNHDAAVQLKTTKSQNWRVISAEEISANILSVLKRSAEEFSGHPIQGAVITVPAYFGERQRQATIDACIIAGLEVKAVLNEPTAAALAYAFTEHRSKNGQMGHSGKRQLLVFDLGGGTFDVTILQHDHGHVQVVSTGGSGGLGGSYFDRALAELLAERYMEQHPDADNPLDDPITLIQFMDAAREAKMDLSHSYTTNVFIDNDGDELETCVTRNTFQELIAPLIEECIQIVQEALSDASITFNDLDDVILIGGSTNIPIVRETVRSLFGNEKVRADINADEAVAMGAAIRAAHGALEPSEKKGTLLEHLKIVDVTPSNLGIKVKGDQMDVIVPANSPLPFVSEAIRYRTTVDDQQSTKIDILEGNNKQASKNRSLASFVVSGFPPMPKGQIKVSIVIKIDDKYGMLDVEATCIANDQPVTQDKVKITKTRGVLSQDRIQLARTQVQITEKKIELKNVLGNAFIALQDAIVKLKESIVKDVQLKKDVDKACKDGMKFIDESKAKQTDLGDLLRWIEWVRELQRRVDLML